MPILQRNRHRQAAVIGSTGDYEGQSLVRNPAGAHKNRPAPPEIGVVNRQPDPARDPQIRAPESMSAADQRRYVGLNLEIVQSRSQIIVVHSRQRVVDLTRGVPRRIRHQVAGDGHRRRREDHVAKIAVGERRAEARPTVGGDVELRVLIVWQVTRLARAAPHVAGEHLVGAVVGGVAVFFAFGFQ